MTKTNCAHDLDKFGKCTNCKHWLTDDEAEAEQAAKTNEPFGREEHLHNRPYACDPVAHIDGPLLAKQRALIGELIEGCDDDEPQALLLLEGIQALLDNIADYAHDTHEIYGALLADGEPCCQLLKHLELFNKEQQ